jgi:hypothetical protein
MVYNTTQPMRVVMTMVALLGCPLHFRGAYNLVTGSCNLIRLSATLRGAYNLLCCLVGADSQFDVLLIIIICCTELHQESLPTLI